jgi:hypothetical protein
MVHPLGAPLIAHPRGSAGTPGGLPGEKGERLRVRQAAEELDRRALLEMAVLAAAGSFYLTQCTRI